MFILILLSKRSFISTRVPKEVGKTLQYCHLKICCLTVGSVSPIGVDMLYNLTHHGNQPLLQYFNITTVYDPDFLVFPLALYCHLNT